MASNSPVEAPDGTAARPVAPELSATSTSTVGLPRLSRIWRAWTLESCSCVSWGIWIKSLAEALRGGAQGKLGVDAQAARLVDGGEELLADPLEGDAASLRSRSVSRICIGRGSSSPAVAARRCTLRA